MEDDGIDFNFWPSFADMMLSLVLVLVLVMFLFVAVKAVGTLNLEAIQKKQAAVVESIADSYRTSAVAQPDEVNKETKDRISVYCIPVGQPGGCEISVRHDAKLQRITFSDHILFKTNESELNEQGRAALSKVTAALRADNRLSTVRQIQIQGHADNARKEDAPRMYNVRLAAERAMAVYEYLVEKERVNPSEHLMSATSFGEFNPVGRAAREGGYDESKLKEDNDGDAKKRLNRRIELLLFY